MESCQIFCRRGGCLEQARRPGPSDVRWASPASSLGPASPVISCSMPWGSEASDWCPLSFTDGRLAYTWRISCSRLRMPKLLSLLVMPRRQTLSNAPAMSPAVTQVYWPSSKAWFQTDDWAICWSEADLSAWKPNYFSCLMSFFSAIMLSNISLTAETRHMGL